MVLIADCTKRMCKRYIKFNIQLTVYKLAKVVNSPNFVTVLFKIEYAKPFLRKIV